MIHLGEGIILIGVLAMIFPFGKTIALTGLILIGLGCAPIYHPLFTQPPHILVRTNLSRLLEYKWRLPILELV